MSDKKRCGAKTRSGGTCKKWALKGKERCKLHGGASTGAPGKNKNAIKTGEHETIWLDQLDDQEQEMFHAMAIDALKQLEDDIKLVNIRIRRMLQRIKRLNGIEMVTATETTSEGMTENGPIQSSITTEENTLSHIQNIEESLTRVQKEKAKLIELKHKIQEGDQDGQDSDDWVAAIQAVAKKRKGQK